MMRLKTIASIAGFGLLGAVAATPAMSATMSVDGSLLNDWGINVQDYTAYCGTNDPTQCIGSNFATSTFAATQNYNGSNKAAATLLGGALKLGSSLDNNVNEDGNDVSNNYGGVTQLSPYYGGQNFDAEFMGAAQLNGKLYIAISTGQRPDNGTADWEPGDLRVVVNSAGGPANGTYGVELGGGAATSSSTAKITGPGGAGSTYNLNSNGYSLGQSSTSWQTGAILKDATFVTPPANATLSTATQLAGGTSIGNVDALYETLNSYEHQHNVIELEIDLATLLGTTDKNLWTAYNLNLTWGPGCGNDLVLTGLQVAANDIPEPMGLALFGLGILGLGVMRRRKAAA